MAYIVGLAGGMFDAAKNDAAFAAKLRTTYDNALLGVIDGSAVSDILGGTKNGATYNARLSFSIDDRMKAMAMAIKGLETGIRPSGYSVSAF